MWISRLAPPWIVTCPTPSAFSSFCLISLSAIRVTSRVERGALTAIWSTLEASGSILDTTGTSALAGSSLTTWLILFCTSWAATLPSLDRANSIRTRLTPSEEVLLSSSSPLMLLTASSIFLVISFSTSSGEAPGLTTVTITKGASILGIRSTPSEK